MSISITIPDPATMRVGKERYIDLQADTLLHRIHPEVYGSDEYNPTNNGDARFSPIRDAADDVIPTIYAAETFECATCEIILRSPDALPTDPKTGMPTLQIVSPDDFKDYAHSKLRTTQSLKLVDLTIAGQRRVGVENNALLAGPKSSYPETRAWAEKIHASCPDAQGISYTSFQYGDDRAIVLFGDRVPDDALETVARRRVADSPCHDEIDALARSLSIDYETI